MKYDFQHCFYPSREHPYFTSGRLWLGAADDVILRKRGVEFVDGTAPGFAAIAGAAPSPEIAKKIAIELNVVGLMNIQYAIAKDRVYVLEANPRASRTVPLVSKVCNIPMARLATQVMLGKKLAEPFTNLINSTTAMSVLYEVIQACAAGMAASPTVERRDSSRRHPGEAARQSPGKTALVVNQSRWTFAEVEAAANRLAGPVGLSAAHDSHFFARLQIPIVKADGHHLR